MNAPFPPLASLTPPSDTLAPPPIKMAAHIFHVANLLVPDLARGRRITAAALRSAMETACGGSDADGAWIWRDAYEACEAAQVLFLRKYGLSMRRQATTPAALLAMLARVAALLPTQTRRSLDSEGFQQFSTPIALGFVAAHAAGITAADHVLEPSAGTGLLAIFAEGCGASIALNELAGTRAALLEALFPVIGVTRHDAARILNCLLALTIAMQNLIFEAFDQILQGKIEGAIASGSYDAGVETIRAASMTISNRRTVHVHKATGAETRVFTVERKDRNDPLLLDEALARSSEKHAKLLVNTKSGRAAVQVPAASLMFDDGELEHRVRLLRPTERHAMGLEVLAQTHWEETDQDSFVAAWVAELAEVPEFSTSTFHVVTGLLLPIWKRIPDETCKVYRLQTDDGERVIGRLISPAGLTAFYRNLGHEGMPAMNAGDAWATVLDGRGALRLADGLQLRRVRVMNDHRVELTGFTEGIRDRLRAMGLFSEIIAWKLRFFVPVGGTGPEVLARLLERHPLIGIAERTAA